MELYLIHKYVYLGYKPVLIYCISEFLKDQKCLVSYFWPENIRIWYFIIKLPIHSYRWHFNPMYYTQGFYQHLYGGVGIKEHGQCNIYYRRRNLLQKSTIFFMRWICSSKGVNSSCTYNPASLTAPPPSSPLLYGC